MRVVTLLPSATEIVARLGAEAQLVAVSHECDQPASVLDRPRLTATTLPDELGTRAIDARVVQAMVHGQPLTVVDADRLADLQPDVVITQGETTVCGLTATHIGLLDGLTDARVVALQARDFAGVLADVDAVGRAIGREPEAAGLVAELQAGWEALSAPDPRGPRVLFAEWPDPLRIGGLWIPELIAHAGGVDAWGTPGQPARRSTWRQALAEQPDVVVFGARETDALANRDAAAFVPTGSARRYAVDGRLTCRPGPRLVDALAALRAVVRDELSTVDPGAVLALPPAG